MVEIYSVYYVDITLRLIVNSDISAGI